MFTYAKNGEILELEHRSLKLVFGFIQSAIDRDKAAYDEKCRINAENASKGGKKKAENAKGANMSYEQLIGSIANVE